MLSLLTIENYRGFEDLKIEPLKRINLIAGKNNVGKTALLQAILLMQRPNEPTHNEFYLLPDLPAPGPDVRTRWGWLFYGKRQDLSVLISGIDNSQGTRTLVLDWRSANSAVTNELNSIAITCEDSTGIFKGHMTNNQAIVIDENRLTLYPLAVLRSGWVRSPKQNATDYSELVAVGRQEELMYALRPLEPRLTQLTLLIVGGETTICGDIGIGHLIPLQLMGEGIQRILSIVLEIAKARNGIVLIDEIENGLHHSVLVDVWRVVVKAARQANVQVFATTHSWECIQSAYQAFEENDPEDFRLHRLERINGKIEGVTYDHESLSGSMQFNLEVR